MSFLSKDQILAAQDRQYAEVDVPEWGGKVRLSSLTARQSLELDAVTKKFQEGKVADPIGPLLVACIVDADGKPIFTKDDLDGLGKKNPAVILRLAEHIKKLNGIAEADAGNSEPSPSAS
jgi:hypothetical protein